MQPAMYKGGYTLKDYLTWPEGERWEIIEGVAYMLSAPTGAHQSLALGIASELRTFLKGKTCRVYISPYDVVFTDDENTDTVVQPDVLVVCDPKKYQNGKRVIGAPDIAVEVLSPSSVMNDYDKKAALYQKHGVKEYWIVSPEARAISQRVLQDGRYGDATIYEDGVLHSSVLEGFELDIKELFAELDDQPE